MLIESWSERAAIFNLFFYCGGAWGEDGAAAPGGCVCFSVCVFVCVCVCVWWVGLKGGVPVPAGAPVAQESLGGVVHVAAPRAALVRRRAVVALVTACAPPHLTVAHSARMEKA